MFTLQHKGLKVTNMNQLDLHIIKIFEYLRAESISFKQLRVNLFVEEGLK